MATQTIRRSGSPTVPPPPSPTDPAVAKAQADAAEAERKIKGRASTIIGGAAGSSLTSTPATTARRTLAA